MLLEAECEAIAVSHGGSGPAGGSAVKRPRMPASSGGGGILAGLLDHKHEGLQLDSAGAGEDAPDYGRQRLSNVADTRQVSRGQAVACPGTQDVQHHMHTLPSRVAACPLPHRAVRLTLPSFWGPSATANGPTLAATRVSEWGGWVSEWGGRVSVWA